MTSNKDCILRAISIIAASIAVSFIALFLYMADSNSQVAAMVKAGANPIEAACAIQNQGSTSDAIVCALIAASHKE